MVENHHGSGGHGFSRGFLPHRHLKEERTAERTEGGDIFQPLMDTDEH
jgi:hypothetical protein